MPEVLVGIDLDVLREVLPEEVEGVRGEDALILQRERHGMHVDRTFAKPKPAACELPVMGVNQWQS